MSNLFFNFNFVQVMNQFTVAGHGDPGPAVMDGMMVTLKDMKVAMCSFDEDMTSIKEINILEPITLAVEVFVPCSGVS